MKEIGGYFELELYNGKEYHKSALRLSSGRNALKYILLAQNVQKVFIPAYICDSVLEPLKELNIPYEFYNIEEKFEIVSLPKVAENQKILYVNYFGLKKKYVDSLVKAYGHKLIIDNTQSFFDLPVDGIDTFYSPRKFFGVSDGGYLYTQHLLTKEISQDYSQPYTAHLLGRLDSDAASFYAIYKEAEQRLSRQPLKHMSEFTRRILSSIRYPYVRQRRKKNFSFLHKALGKYNLLKLDFDSVEAPFIYPFINNDPSLRNRLIGNKIYVATYWQEVLSNPYAGETERRFAEKIIPLPVDQRYNIKDIKQIYNLIR